jgi:hypothetical protein
MAAMAEAMKKSAPAGQDKPLPPKDKFIAACKTLPEGMQKCMALPYAMSHQQECQDVQKKADPAAMAKAKEMMGK